jgi:hypothetical protein
MHRFQRERSLGRARRLAAVALGLAGAGLVTALFAAQSSATPDDPGALNRAIKQQRVASGQLIAENKADEHAGKAPNIDEMLLLSTQYEAEIQKLQTQAEGLRQMAYRSKDIIRMNCIDDKLIQVRTVLNIVRPRFGSIRENRQDEMTVRGQFTLIQQAIEHVRELDTEMRSCLGDVLDNVTDGTIPVENPGAGNYVDPTHPPEPGVILERPPEASTYR